MAGKQKVEIKNMMRAEGGPAFLKHGTPLPVYEVVKMQEYGIACPHCEKMSAPPLQPGKYLLRCPRCQGVQWVYVLQPGMVVDDCPF